MAPSDSNTCSSCTCSTCTGIRGTINKIFSALDIYGWMLDAYVVDFFQENLWNKFPSSWKSLLDQISLEELGKWILKNDYPSKQVWPLSLLALRKFIENAEICRDHKKMSALKCSMKLSGGKGDTISSAESNKNLKSSKYAQMSTLFTKHVKKKKRYEIDIMSEITANCAKNANCNCIVDIGSGMGHLARVLAYKYNFYVVCVEQNETLLEGASKLDEQLLASLARHMPDFRGRSPRHVSLQVGASSATGDGRLAGRLARLFAEEFERGPDELGEIGRAAGFGLIGLHPCGDLAATLLRLYAAEEEARFICIVGCCYMKLTREGAEQGYPMSDHLRAINANRGPSYAALEVACHAVEKHCLKLQTNDCHDLMVHAYRAALECLLVEKNPELRRSRLNNVKVRENAGSFEQYCKSATGCLEPVDRPTQSDCASVWGLLGQWKRVVAFGTLRMMLAPLVETLVLLDRFLYLSERELSPSIKAEFDRRISPRNILLVSVKKSVKN